MELEPQKEGVRQVGNGGPVYFEQELVGVRGVSEQEGQTWLIFELTLVYIGGLLLTAENSVGK